MSAITMTLDECIRFHPDDIGLNEYPAISDQHRETLNKLIIDQYINREIGQETFSLFRHAMRRKMAQIMPYYNQLIRSESLIIDPFKTVDIKTLSVSNMDSESESETSGQRISRSEGSSDTAGTSRAVASELPQTVLSENGAYASSAQDGNSSSKVNSNGVDRGEESGKTKAKSDDTAVSDSNTVGFQGSQMQLLSEYRSLFLNVNMQIVDELDSLFMQVWNTSQSYTGHGRFI